MITRDGLVTTKLEESISLIRELMVDENNSIGDDQVDCIWCYAVHCYDRNDNPLPVVHSDTCAWKRAKAWIIENAGKEQVCEWRHYVNDAWITSCGRTRTLEHDYTPEELDMEYCFICGRRIVVKE
jgi:hypothetical protein